MSKKKKTSAKQTKPNLQKPSAKPAKEATAPKKSAPETSLELDVPSKSVQAQPEQAKGKKLDQSATKSSKPESSKAKTEPTAKPEPIQPGPEQSSSKGAAPKSAQSQPKQQKKDNGQPPAALKKQEDAKPSPKSPKSGKGSKKKAPRQAAETASSPVEPAVSEADQQELVAAATPTAEEPSPPEAKRKVPKTLVDEETDFTPGRQGSEGDSMSASQPQSAAPAPVPADPPASAEAPRKVAKTILEVNIGGLKEAAAKATGIENQTSTPSPDQRKIDKTLMDASTEGLRDAVEASSRAIEDEIAAAIRESDAHTEGHRDVVEASARAIEDEIATAIRESEAEAAANPTQASEPTAAEQMVAAAAKNPDVKQADRKIAKTMLDFKADELFELANSDIDTLVEEVELQAPSTPVDARAPAASQPAAAQPRKVAKTMLEVDVPDVNAIVEAAQASAIESVAQAPEPAAEEPVVEQPVAETRRSTHDEVSMEDLNEFAQALREDKPMSARAERLRKTMLGIRKHGLASSASMPGVGTTGEAKQPEIAAQDAPVRVSRSLHPLDNFSFDDVCPADDHTQTDSQSDSQPDQPVDGQAESQPDVQAESVSPGTVELDHDPHEAPEGEFKGVSTVWPHDQEQQDQQRQQRQQREEAKAGTVKPERFVPKTMLDMDFLKESLSASVVRAEEKMAESIALKASAPPKQTLTSDDYKVATPNCPFVWTDDGMSKDRVRYCTQCSSQVYDFSGFDMAEVQSLIFKRENRENVTLYKREDGKFITVDCPIAVKKRKDKTMLIGGAALGLVLLLVMVIASFMTPQPTSVPTANPDAAPSAPSSAKDLSSPPSGTSTSSGKVPGATSATDGSPKFGKTGGHYVRGKGVVERAPVIIQPQPADDANPPGTTSGYDAGGQFWQYTEKSNN